jgi:hypothetical protein
MAIATFVLASLVWSLLASASICRRAYSFEIEKLRQSRELLISHLYLFHERLLHSRNRLAMSPNGHFPDVGKFPAFAVC